MADLMGVELARPGQWHLSSGPLTVTPSMLDDAARFAAREGGRPAAMKIGHTDTRFAAGDGEPALGWVRNLRVEDDNGHVLKGDLTGMPDWLAKAMPSHWPDRSIEGFADHQDTDGQKYGLVVDALALLGVTPPGMASIRSLRDLPQALGIAASAGSRRIVASFGDPTSSAPEAVGPPPTRKGAGMDPVQIREALGLTPDASDDDVRAAFAASPLAPPAPAPVAAAAGTVVIASSVWDETQKTIQKLNAQHEVSRRNERDEVITKAVAAGKFTPAQREHFSRMWDSAPEPTRALIEVMTPNTAFAVAASGYAGEGVDATEDEYLSMFAAVDARKAG